MSEQRKVFVFGASGHAKVVLDILARAGVAVELVVDDDPARTGQVLLGYRVAGGRESLRARKVAAASGIVAIGGNAPRLAVAQWLASEGFGFARAVHPAAVVGAEVEIEEGTVVMAGAVVNPAAAIGRHCIVNTCASIDHDCRIGDGVHIAPGARLCGGVTVGHGAFVGAGAVIVPGRRVGAGAIIGAGAVVLQDVVEGATVAGNPARPRRNDDPGRPPD